MDDPTRQFIFGVAAPALITGALLVPGWLRKPPEGTQREPWPWRIPLALGLPVTLAFLALYGWSWKGDSWLTAAFAPMLGVGASFILLFRRSWMRIAVTVALAAALAVLVHRYTRPEHWTIKVLPAALTLTLVAAMESLAARTKGPSIALPLALSAAAAIPLVLLTGWLKLTVPLVALTVSMFVLAAYSLLRRNLSLTRGPLFVLLPTTSTALLFAWLEARSKELPIPPAAFVIVALAPLALWLGEIPWIRSRSLWFAAVLRVTFVAAPCAAGVYLAATAQKPAPASATEEIYRTP